VTRITEKAGGARPAGAGEKKSSASRLISVHGGAAGSDEATFDVTVLAARS
jgi:hypothetical protein